MVKLCQHCGKIITSKDAKYFCSQRCKGLAQGSNRVKRICKICGAEFEVFPGELKRRTVDYCSKTCKGIGMQNQEEIICAQCGKHFTCNKGNHRKFCSRKCATESQRVTRYCEICGKTIVKHSKRFCSKECAQIANRGENHPSYKEKIERFCEVCGVRFEVVPAIVNYGQGRFCSRRCFGMAKARDMHGNGYSRARGGRREDLGGLYVRSGWEANYARYLNWLAALGEIQKWEYEPDTFEFESIKKGVQFYTPDFKVWENDGSINYHEIKGWMDKKSQTKLNRMSKYHPKVKIILIDSPSYYDIEKKVGKLIPNWEWKE